MKKVLRIPSPAWIVVESQVSPASVLFQETLPLGHQTVSPIPAGRTKPPVSPRLSPSVQVLPPSAVWRIGPFIGRTMPLSASRKWMPA